MYYLKSQPNEAGNYGNPVSNRTGGMVALPDELLTEYINTMGFAYLTIEDETVTAVAINQEAYDNYQESIPEPEPPEPTEEDDVNAMLVDHEYRLTLVELGLN